MLRDASGAGQYVLRRRRRRTEVRLPQTHGRILRFRLGNQDPSYKERNC